ncbi:hypothetical protein EV363DRAFT_1328239 [Boletus edulis]|nr:hypothetical protein EV363DRAFT_1328239 [Boletus edulis]
MHPALGEPVFAQWYTSEGIRTVSAALLGCDVRSLQMGHRDDVRENTTTEEERKALASWSRGVRHVPLVHALYEDACLYLVPKSHKVPRTDEQRAHSTTLEPPRDPLAMPGAIRLVLQPGETVFYDSNILHCATYDAKQRRATLHATMGDTRGGLTRARNVLQHGLEWMQEKRFRETLDEAGQRMLDALIEMRNGVQGEVGYSLTG